MEKEKEYMRFNKIAKKKERKIISYLNSESFQDLRLSSPHHLHPRLRR